MNELPTGPWTPCRATLSRPPRAALQDGTSLGLSGALMNDLRWQHGQRVKVVLADTGAQLLLSVTTDLTARKIYVHRGSGQLWLKLPWVTIGPLPAAEVTHAVLERDGNSGTLLITLPEWAVPPAPGQGAEYATELAIESQAHAARIAAALPALWADPSVSTLQIAARLGVSATTIRSHAEKLRLQPVRPAAPAAMSESRALLMRAAWVDGRMTLEQIRQALNAADPASRPLKSATCMYRLARRINLPVPRFARKIKPAKVNLQQIQEEDLREARVMAACKRRPEEIAEWFGWSKEQAQSVIDDVQEKIRRAA